MYTLMLSDLDETLLVNNHVTIENSKAIKKARMQGLKFVPATGRAYNMIPEILKELGTYDTANEYSICFNGALIVENKNHKILRFRGLSFAQAREIFDVGKEYTICVLIFTLDMCYIFNADAEEVNRKRLQNAPFKVVDTYDMDFLKGEKIAKILFQKRDMEYLRKIEKEIEEITRNKVSVSYSSNRYLEVNDLGINKGEALQWLADYLGVTMESTIAMGDNYNDVEMIKTAALGVAVNCAEDDIKEIADYVTKQNYDEDAVKEVIEKFILEEIKSGV